MDGKAFQWDGSLDGEIGCATYLTRSGTPKALVARGSINRCLTHILPRGFMAESGRIFGMERERKKYFRDHLAGRKKRP